MGVRQDPCVADEWFRSPSWDRAAQVEFPEGAVEFQRAAAMESLGDLARKQGDLEGAEICSRRLLELSPTLNGTSQMAEVSLAEVLIAHASGQRPPPEASQLLASAVSRHGSGMFDSQIMRCLLVDAALAELDDDLNRRAAGTSRVRSCTLGFAGVAATL
jgi:hypothetical protein